jgi:putative transposase
MKLTVKVKLLPTDNQWQLLKQTLETANAACNWISRQAWESQTFGRVPLHKLTYYPIREQFKLSAQLAVRSIAKVKDAYIINRSVLAEFRPLGAIAFDDRILTWDTPKRQVSIWTLGGRQDIAYQTGQEQGDLLLYQKGESDLYFAKSTRDFFLLATCELPEPEEQPTPEFLGFDMNRSNIGADSDGDIYSNETLEQNRKRYKRLRRNLKKRHTASARKHLKKMGNRENRFRRDVNHCVSKHLVLKAQRTGRGVAIEDLNGIRKRTRVRGKEERDKHNGWSFAQLGMFIRYKARLWGLPLKKVNPRYTSQRCAECGYIEKANRCSQSEFLCVKCGHRANADVNAARNISERASVNTPYATPREAVASP